MACSKIEAGHTRLVPEGERTYTGSIIPDLPAEIVELAAAVLEPLIEAHFISCAVSYEYCTNVAIDATGTCKLLTSKMIGKAPSLGSHTVHMVLATDAGCTHDVADLLLNVVGLGLMDVQGVRAFFTTLPPDGQSLLLLNRERELALIQRGTHDAYDPASIADSVAFAAAAAVLERRIEVVVQAAVARAEAEWLQPPIGTGSTTQLDPDGVDGMRDL